MKGLGRSRLSNRQGRAIDKDWRFAKAQVFLGNLTDFNGEKGFFLESTERVRNSRKNLSSSHGWSSVTGDICENWCQLFIRKSRLRRCFASFACVFSLPFFLLYPFGSLLVSFVFMFVLRQVDALGPLGGGFVQPWCPQEMISSTAAPA